MPSSLHHRKMPEWPLLVLALGAVLAICLPLRQILVDAARIDDVAGARTTLWALVGVFGLAGVTVVPALAYLYWLTQRRVWLEIDPAAMVRVE